MADSPGISGLSVGLLAAGGVLVVSAVRNQSVADTLRQVIGRPTSGQAVGTALGSVASGVQSFAAAGAAAGSAAAGVAAAAAGGPLVAAARKYLGVKYVYGGTSKTGVDCSGLVVLSLKGIGLNPPRFTTATFGTWAKAQGWTRLSSGWTAGDIVCRSGHMGIAVSASRLIHAPHTGTVVQEAAMWDLKNWWAWRMSASDTAIKAGNTGIGKGAGLL